MPNPQIEKYTDVHLGEGCVIFGTGPSLEKYDGRYNDLCLIGSNEIIHYPTQMDYYFIGDGGTEKRGYYHDPHNYHKYVAKKKKFIRMPPPKRNSSYRTMPLGLDGFEYYTLDAETSKHGNVFRKGKLVDAGAISFDALQFALVAGFRKIYLVGHDCNYDKGSFVSKVDNNIKRWGNVILRNWSKAKQFIDNEYPDVKVTVINPVSMNFF
jgi:hypothetical protein